MTLEQIKEELSNKYIGILACNKGYKLIKPDDTGGVDYSVTYDVRLERNGKCRYIQSGRYIDLQLKSTTEESIIYVGNKIKYDLEVKTYNDLIERKRMGNAPLILVVFILPIDLTNWVSVQTDELLLRKNAFWFYPDENMDYSSNLNQIRIEIPVSNKLGINFFKEMFSNFF